MPANSTFEQIWYYVSGNALLRNFTLRVHKFTFQWDLFMHLTICILALVPFAFTGHHLCILLPVSVWVFYNTLFLVGIKRANSLVPGFANFKHTFKTTMEEFFSQKLLPVISISYLLVSLSLSVTGQRLDGPPLCFQPCGACLASWGESVFINKDTNINELDENRIGCGVSNGKELLGYYTMVQTSFLLFVTVIIAMAVCMAWKVAQEELSERQAAETWLKTEDPMAFTIREEIIKLYGAPASFIRPEGNVVWVFYGIIAALSFTLFGWDNWSVLPPSSTASLLIALNLLTILTSALILHLGFFGRLLSLYQRNFLRVQCLTKYISDCSDQQLDAWWNCRSFVLNDDLAIDYDLGGLAVSATFLINIVVFFVLIAQTYREGLKAMMEPPGNYCAYACLYITMCLLKIFTLATSTYEEQHRHIQYLQSNSQTMRNQPSWSAANNNQSSASLSMPIDIDNTSETDALLRKEKQSDADPIDTLENATIKNVSSTYSLTGYSPTNNTPTGFGMGLQDIDNSSMSAISAVNRSSTVVATLTRGSSIGTSIMDNRRQSMAEMVAQIRKYDPYPCILGIPVMPALFASCKFYIFISFLLIGTRMFIQCIRIINFGDDSSVM